jgi:hypothetical protein
MRRNEFDFRVTIALRFDETIRARKIHRAGNYLKWRVRKALRGVGIRDSGCVYVHIQRVPKP